jgi:protein involved in polysaccharide export with SLBB domain
MDQPARSISLRLRGRLVAALSALLLMPVALAQTVAPEAADNASGTIRLRQPAPMPVDREGASSAPAAESAYVPGEFERFVQSRAGAASAARRLGSELVTQPGDARGAELSPLVPEDYVIGPGDEVIISLWGSVDADLRLVVDRSGQVTIPRVGAVQVSGTRYGDLTPLINRRVAQVFKNFQSSVSLGQLRGIRVFVTGFVAKPGTYSVGSLSSVVSTLMRAGGPSASGSFRSIELRRGAEVVSRFDLYDLLARGDRSADRVVQAGDVVHVGPVGTQVGVIGSVNRPAIVELKAGETLADALRYAGGFSAVADRSRIAVERLRDRNSGRVTELSLPMDAAMPLSEGDVVLAFSAVDSQISGLRQRKRVRIEGEVGRPGEYVLHESSTLLDAIKAAGGLTAAAYLPAAEFTRERVRATQQENYDKALRDLETDLSRARVSRRSGTADEAAAQQASDASVSRLIERLRLLKPTGRLVLNTDADRERVALPDLALEDGDRLMLPSQPTTVGVFGSVFNAASYLHQSGRTLGDYLRLAGGPTKGADEGSIFVIRANGQVISSRQGSSGWFRSGNSILPITALPGDTVFVPEELDKTTFLQSLKDWTQVLYQLGVGAAGIRSAIQ